MTSCQNDDQFLIEEHSHKNASVLFTKPVLELFDTYAKRHELAGALAEEIDSIPSTIIPYGTLTYMQMIFVFQAAWDEKNDKWLAQIDMATQMIEIGEICVPDDLEAAYDELSDEEQTTTH